MEACSFCQGEIQGSYFRVGPLIACSPCADKERANENVTKWHYLRRGLLFAAITALAASLLMWGVDEFSSFAGNGLFSAGAFLRGAAVVFAGRFMGAAAIQGAKRRGSSALQIGVVLLTYLAWAMSYVWLLLEKVPAGTLSVSRVLALVLMGPILPWLLVAKNPLAISGIIMIAIACATAWRASAKLNLVSGPFDSGYEISEKPMFQGLR